MSAPRADVVGVAIATAMNDGRGHRRSGHRRVSVWLCSAPCRGCGRRFEFQNHCTILYCSFVALVESLVVAGGRISYLLIFEFITEALRLN